MRNRDDGSGYGLFRQLQLIETESEEKDIPPPTPALRRRISRTPLRAVNRIRFEKEVRISPALDGSSRLNSVGAARQGAIAAIGADRALFDRLAAICEKIANGYYNGPDVLNTVARRIVASGELGNPTNEH